MNFSQRQKIADDAEKWMEENNVEKNAFGVICYLAIKMLLKEKPYENDPIRWDIPKKDIERQMYLFDQTIETLENHNRYILAHEIKKMKKQWQGMIDWNIQEGNWI